MKTPAINRNRIVSYLRFTVGSAFFAAAAALAIVATTTNVMNTQNVAAAKQRAPVMHSQMQDSIRGTGGEVTNKDRHSVVTPHEAALEDAANRAYPATEIPFSATLNSIISMKRFLITSASAATPTPTSKGIITRKNKKQPPEAPRFNSWSLVGPTTASFPAVLTFSGAPYNTSGRITALALDPTSPAGFPPGCTPSYCRLWVGAAGGGVWRTTNALSIPPTWTYLTATNVSTNAVGALTYDAVHGVLYLGTGEPNASADSEAGLGIFTSIDGGDHWSQVPSQVGPITTFSPGTGSNGTYTGNAFFGRAISRIVLDPTNFLTYYVATARAVRGVDSQSAGATSNPPAPRPPFGLYKTTDGGAHFSFIWDGSGACPGFCNGTDPAASLRGVIDLKLDPSNHNIVYASAYPSPFAAGGGVWRSNDGGTTWTQILPPLVPNEGIDRPAFDVVSLGGGVTRMYVNDGSSGPPGPANGFNPSAMPSQVFRSDAVQTGVPVFTNLTAAEVPAGQSSNTCTQQCWYDNYVVASQEFPQVVWVGGAYDYAQFGGNTNGRTLIASDTSGTSWFDWTWDAQNNGLFVGQCCNPDQAPVLGPAPNGMHPDNHAFAVVPGTGASIIFSGSDGGLVRTDGFFQDVSGQCTSVRVPDGTVSSVPLCQQLLGIVPNQIISMNQGLSTLQFQSLVFAANNPSHIQGGTQDNGTFETFGALIWPQIIYGDGGQSGINTNNSFLRFNTFTGQANDANFQNGNPTKWVIIGGPIASSPEGSFFYPPIIADPTSAAAGSIFQGSFHVWRTQDWGGSQAFLEANCPEFTTAFFNPACGDFVPLGGAAGANNPGDLTGTFYGGDRVGGAVSVIERTTSNTNVAWAATSRGRVFVSTNVDGPAGSVVWNRIDANLAGSADPTRFPDGIAINPFNVFQAWVSYNGYNFNTSTHPGHVFQVNWSGAGTAVWTNMTFNLPDIPITSVVFDPVKGDAYASSDFTVFRLKSGTTTWDLAGVGLPLVEVTKLTINPGPARLLYASTHGRSAWTLPLY